MRKIGVYCRVSTDEQAEHGYNLREQELRIKQYISAFSEDFSEEIETYIDDGYSAKDLKRREMTMLISDIEAGLISKVIVHNLDRLTRNIIDLMYLVDLFERKNVQLFSLKEKIDTESAIGRFFVSVIVLIAQWEREAISERTIRGLDQSASEGNYVFGQAPFGYKLVNKKLVKKEPEAGVVKLIFHLYYNQENSIAAISHIMADKYPDNLSWSFETVKRILTNKIYKGTFQNKRVTLEHHSPAIVTEDLFEATQEALNSRQNRDRLNYLFGRKCYEFTTGENLALDSSKKKDVRYLYYYSKDTNCRVNEEVINGQIGLFINDYFKKMINDSISSIIKTVDRYTDEIDVLDYLLMNAIISNRYYAEATEKISKNGIAKTELQYNLKSQVEKWDTLSRGEKKYLVKKHVKKIVVDTVSKTIKSVEFYDNV